MLKTSVLILHLNQCSGDGSNLTLHFFSLSMISPAKRHLLIRLKSEAEGDLEEEKYSF